MIDTRAHAVDLHRAGLKLAPWLAAVCLLSAGCSSWKKEEPKVVRTCPPPTRTIAVAPALNFSGSAAVDAVQAADLMASELAQVEGMGVVGVNRVLAVLAEQGVDRVMSPEHAVQICERIGADAILVFAITEYDAYTPVVGLAAQLYGTAAVEKNFDPVATSRMARPFPVAPEPDAQRPWAQTQRTFNAERDDIRSDVQVFADQRHAGRSPFGWKKYLVSQQWFLRYCCHAVCGDLLRQWEGEATVPAAAAADGNGRECGT